MPIGLIPKNEATSPKWKQYAAGGPRDLVADGPPGGFCCRKIVLLEAGSLTLCEDANSVDSPLTGLPAGYEHIGAVTRVTSSGAIIVYW
jgi:hypothetical protein